MKTRKVTKKPKKRRWAVAIWMHFSGYSTARGETALKNDLEDRLEDLANHYKPSEIDDFGIEVSQEDK